MKNLVVALAVMMALMCSPACAQKKPEPSSASKAQTSLKGSPVSTTRRVSGSKQNGSDKDTAGSGTTKSSKKEATADKSSSDTSAAEKKAAKTDSQEAVTNEQQKKIKSMMRQTLKPFAVADLTDEQREKADEVFGKAVKDYVTKRSRAMITDELQKKQSAAMKAAKTSGKNAREQAKEAFTTAGFSEEQIKVFKATQASLDKANANLARLSVMSKSPACPSSCSR